MPPFLLDYLGHIASSVRESITYRIHARTYVHLPSDDDGRGVSCRGLELMKMKWSRLSPLGRVSYILVPRSLGSVTEK